FTLLTGDVVRLVTAPDGSHSGEVVYDAGPQGDVVFQQINDDYYALTGEAVRQIGEGRLDMELFNLTALAEYGYDDASVDAVPVVATYDNAAVTPRSIPRPPAGTSRVQALESADAQALAVDKASVEKTW